MPNASVMVVEHAERFGLSQLHQLRGRVGRDRHQSYCCLLYQSPLSDDARERLKAMTETTDGFEIAERDLLLRGPGDFFGTRQAGVPTFRLIDLVRDRELLDVGAARSGGAGSSVAPAPSAATLRWRQLLETLGSRGSSSIEIGVSRDDRADAMRVIAGSLKGRRLKTPDVGRAAADVRQAARDAVQHPGAADRRRARARRLRRHRRARHRGAQPRRARRHVHRAGSPRAGADRRRTWRTAESTTGYTIIRGTVARAVAALADRRSSRRSTSSCSTRRTRCRADDGADADGDGDCVAPGGVVVLEHARRAAGAGARPGRLVRVAGRACPATQRADVLRSAAAWRDFDV